MTANTLASSPRRLTTPQTDLQVPADAPMTCRPFFMGGILVILTAGAVWGAWLLWQIGFAGSFTALSIHRINAHGHAQIFGWVGLFIMGFGSQVFPSLWGTRRWCPALLPLSFALMILGLILCTPAIALPQVAGAAEVALLGGVITTLAVMLFALQMFMTWRRSEAAIEPWTGFVLVALFWFFAQSAVSTWHTWNLMTAIDREQMLWFLATYQAPLRDMQIHGLALCMILGVSMRLLPEILGTGRTAPRRGWWALGLITLAVIGEVVLFVLYRHTGNHRLAALLMLPWLALAAGVLCAVWPWGLWNKLAQGDRSAKFIRTAYAWLAFSLVMLLLLPLHPLVSGMAFSHAYYGAIRHAITVGFVSLMIMGMAPWLLAQMRGLDTRRLSGLWGPFILVNIGCLLRVGLQVATDFTPVAFGLVGVSGVLEVAGLAWWAASMIGLMLSGRRQTRALAGHPDHEPVPRRLAAYHCVGDVVRWYPETLTIMVAMGFAPVRHRLFRHDPGGA